MPKKSFIQNNTSDNQESDGIRPVKRRRDADQRILDQFWVICDSNAIKREKSLKTIIEILIKQNETNESNDLSYCLERVVRGMASARQFARQGFCLLLTQLLIKFKDDISVEMVYTLAEKHLSKTSEISNHDSVIGWSLLMASVLRSRRLTNGVEEEIWIKCFNVLYNLGINKQYIELVVCQLITDLIQQLNCQKTLFKKVVLNPIRDDIKTENRFKPFFIYLCLYVLHNFPDFCDKKLELDFMVRDENLVKLSVIIRESTAYQPLVHPMNEYIVKHFVVNHKKDFSNFWIKSIDDVLFSPNQIEKGLLGFEFIKISLHLIKSVENVSTVLSPSFLRLFIQSLSVKSHPLHNASQKLCEFFITFVKQTTDSGLQLEIINSFTKKPGSLLFDEISKSKFFTNLSKNMNSISIKEWTEKLKTIFVSTKSIDSNDILRIRCIQQISNTCKSITSSEDTDILWSNIKFLFIHSYFDINDDFELNDRIFKKPVVPISERLRNALRDSFRNVFYHLIHFGPKSTKEKLIQEVATMTSMLEFANELIANDNISCLTDSAFLESFHKIVKTVHRLNKKLKSNTEKQNEIRIFILLLTMFSIQVFEEYEEIENILPDFIECMKRAIDEQSEEDSDSTLVWADVLTELMLSMLTTPSKLTKNVLYSGFRHICSQITNTGLQRLVEAIIPSNDNQLFGENDDSNDEEEGEEDIEKSDSESESESEEETQNMEIDEQFRNDVINALGPAAQNEDDEESVYMSDSEMFQLDDTLAAVFKTKYTDKKESMEKQESIIVFRNRCLDLVQIFLNHKDISLDQVFQLIEPIVSVAKRFSQTKHSQLSQKCIHLIQLITKFKDSNDCSLDVNDLKKLFEYLMKILSKTIHLELQKSLNSLSIWTIQMSKKLFENDFWYSTPVENAIKSYFEKNNCQISGSLFKNMISVHSEIGVKFFDLFFVYAFDEDIRPFKKAIAMDLLYDICRTNSSKTNPNLITKKQFLQIRKKVTKVLCNELSNEKLKAQYVCQLLRLYELTDNHLTDENPDLKISDNEYQDLSEKMKSLSKQKRKKLNNKQLIKKLMSNQKIV